MPRAKRSRSAFNVLKKQANKVLGSLRREIAQKEKELSSLRQDAQRLQSVVNGKASAAVAGPVRQRLDWNLILKELPGTFSSHEVGVKSGKPMEQVYAGLNRWIKDRKVRKAKQGGYEKMGAAAR
ncbi:MAG: hypothetical protein FJ147_08995 [Deltaproteobacteria bacterium]|nr:hypothetical protein [Deltaproteobacteria bacterium]